MNKIVIELQNIKRNFQVGDETVHALRGVSFSIREGEFVTIMGTSGSGKSTLLNTLGCLDTPTSGEYLLDGVSVRTMSIEPRFSLIISPFTIPSNKCFFPSRIRQIAVRNCAFLFCTPCIFCNNFCILASALCPSPPA